jgi:hypothetical protein
LAFPKQRCVDASNDFEMREHYKSLR